MEELRSTEILDREIQEDARRKAEKILKSNEAECRQILEEVDRRIAALRTDKGKEYAERLEVYKRDVQASIPLEKQRRLVSFIDNEVNQALDAWFTSIGESRRLSVYRQLLLRFKKSLNGKKMMVKVSGYAQDEARKLVESVFSPEAIDSVTVLDAPGKAALSLQDGFYLEDLGKTLSCRAGEQEVKNELLSTRREELAKALMGGRIPQ
ncbi:MAG: hypothetical protein JW875_07830 [Spirochaetales bacterium]|nr:hypothetical protein [Spirochaetales bacterium]